MKQVKERSRGVSGKQKLNREQVLSIRESSEKLKTLTQKYDVSEATISKVKAKVSFSNLT